MTFAWFWTLDTHFCHSHAIAPWFTIWQPYFPPFVILKSWIWCPCIVIASMTDSNKANCHTSFLFALIKRGTASGDARWLCLLFTLSIVLCQLDDFKHAVATLRLWCVFDWATSDTQEQLFGCCAYLTGRLRTRRWTSLATVRVWLGDFGHAGTPLWLLCVLDWATSDTQEQHFDSGACLTGRLRTRRGTSLTLVRVWLGDFGHAGVPLWLLCVLDWVTWNTQGCRFAYVACLAGWLRTRWSNSLTLLRVLGT